MLLRLLLLIGLTSTAASTLAATGSTSPGKCAAGASAMTAMLSGRFDNARQFDRADASLKVAPTVTGTWLDRQHARFAKIVAEDLGSNVLYLEWRSGGADGAVSRQRIWAVDEDAACNVSMRFYSLRSAIPPGTLPDTLVSTDLIAYPDSCAMRWKSEKAKWDGLNWIGRIDPARCRIIAQSGRGMRLDVTVVVDGDGFDYQEAGILDSGVKAFAVPPTMPYRFDRLN